MHVWNVLVQQTHRMTSTIRHKSIFSLLALDSPNDFVCARHWRYIFPNAQHAEVAVRFLARRATCSACDTTHSPHGHPSARGSRFLWGPRLVPIRARTRCNCEFLPNPPSPVSSPVPRGQRVSQTLTATFASLVSKSECYCSSNMGLGSPRGLNSLSSRELCRR